MIDLRETGVTVAGPFFTKDVTKTIRGNVEDAVDELSKEGAKLVRGNLRAGIRAATGFTEGSIEGGALKRHNLFTGAEVGSIYGRVRMRAGLARGGSAKYPASGCPHHRGVLSPATTAANAGRTSPATAARARGSSRPAGRRADPGPEGDRPVHEGRPHLRRMAKANAADLTRGLE